MVQALKILEDYNTASQSCHSKGGPPCGPAMAMREHAGSRRGLFKVSWEWGKEALTFGGPHLEEQPAELSPESGASICQADRRVLEALWPAKLPTGAVFLVTAGRVWGRRW